MPSSMVERLCMWSSQTREQISEWLIMHLQHFWMVGLLALFGGFCTTCVCQLNTNTCVWLQSFAFCWVVGVQHTVNEAWLFQRNRKCVTNGTSVKTVFIWRGDYCLIHISVAIQKGVWWCNALNIFRRGICQNCNLHNIPWIMSSLQALWSLRLNTVFWKTYQRKVSHSMDSSFSQVSGSVSNASIRPIRMQCATHPKEGKKVTVLVFTVWFFSAIQRILHFLTRTASSTFTQKRKKMLSCQSQTFEFLKLQRTTLVNPPPCSLKSFKPFPLLWFTSLSSCIRTHL